MEKEKEKQKSAPEPLLHLALRCARASLLLSSLRQSPRSTTTTRPNSSSSSSAEFEARLLDAELAAARREAAGLAGIAGADLLLVVALVPLLFLYVGLLAAAAAA